MTKHRSKFDIFISYSSSDRGIAERLYSFLSKEVSVFLDVHSLAVGDQWDYEIAHAQRTALLSALIITDTTPSVFYSREEVAAAITAVRQDREVQRVVPVYVGRRTDYGARLPYGLRDIQALHAQGERDLGIIAQELLSILARLENERSLRESSSLSNISNLPARTASFLGRDQALSQLSIAFHQQNNIRPIAILGAGGIGKTQLALEYCYKSRGEFSICWWVRAHDADLLLRDLSALSIRLGVPVANDSDSVSLDVVTHLRQTGVPWLVVFDDLVDYMLIQDWLDQSDAGNVMITSRVRPPNPLTGRVAVVALDGLDLEEAVEFLIAETGRDDRSGASKVASRLRGLPLALRLAASQIKQNDVSFEAYDHVLGSYGFGKKNDIAAYLAFPIAKLREEHPTAFLLLELLSLLANVGTPLWLLEGEQKPGLTTGQLNEATKILESQGFAVFEGARFALVHVLLKEQIQREMDASTKKARRTELLELLLRGFPIDAADPETWQRSFELLPHVHCLAELSDEDSYEAILLLLDRAARFAISRADLSEAGQILETAAAIARKFLGEEDLSTRSILGNLAVNLRAKGEVHHALRLQQKLFQKGLILEGRDSANTLSAMSNLADTFRSIGRLSEARALQEEILTRYDKSLGCEHPLTTRAVNNLAGTLSMQGDLAGAHLLQERLVSILSTTLGPENLTTTRAISNLAMTKKSLGRLDEALELQQKVCALLADSLGESHPDTLANLSNLAGTMLARGGSDEARYLYEKVLAGYISLYGQSHPDTLNATSNLAYVLAQAGDFQKALNLNRRTLTQYERIFGEEHPSTLNVMNNLADVLGRMGSVEEARELIEKVINRATGILGEDHPLVLTNKNNLATVLFRLGEVESAWSLCQQVLESRTRVLGAQHPETQLSAKNLESIRRALP